MNEDLTPDQIKHITDYMLIERTALRKADVIFVFGNKVACDALADEAASLYAQGYAPRIIVCGGVKTQTGECEAAHLARRLRERGVPGTAIITEDISTNTQENIEHGRFRLSREFNGAGVGSIIAVGHICAARRFLMTLAKRWHHATHMFVGVNPYETPIAQWHTDPLFRQNVISEYKKIPGYLARGFLEEVDIAAINKKVALLP